MSSTFTPTESLIGQTLQGRYRILEFVAEGGMGAVYRAERLGLELSVAIKFLRPILAADTQGRRRFEREAKAMSRLDHPNCVSVTDFGMDPNPYIVMEFVSGETVRQIFDRGRVDLERSLYICQQILAGLAHAHDRQIVHRDIKPPNIMITAAQGTEGLVRILDFGLAKLHTNATNSDESSPFLVVGTPHYMSPEQASADKTDSRADLYSVGVILFEAVTGAKPFEAAEIRETLRMHREASIPRISKVAPDLNAPIGLQQIIDKAMAKRPEDRYQTAAEFSEAIISLRDSLKLSRTRAAGKSRGAVAFAETQETPRIDLPASGVSLASEPLVAPLRASTPRASSSGRLLFLLLLTGSAAFAYFDPLELVPDWAAPWSSSAARAPKVAPRAEAVAGLAAPHKAADDEAVQEVAPSPLDAGPVDAAAQLDVDAAWEDELDPDELLDESEADELAADALEEDELDESALDESEVDQEDEVELAQLDTEKPINVESPDLGEDQAVPAQPIRNVADARARAADGKRSEAIVGLRELRKAQPNAPYVRLLLGDLYFEQRWWSDGMAEYAAAIDQKQSLRKRALISQNAILALGSAKTRRKARALLVNKIGRASLPHLRRATAKGKNRTIAKHAASLIAKITGSKAKTKKKGRNRR